jgi:hypothetical protein
LLLFKKKQDKYKQAFKDWDEAIIAQESSSGDKQAKVVIVFQ